MEISDIVLSLDRKYSRQSTEAVPCPNEGQSHTFQSGFKTTSHGALGAHSSGGLLVCGVCGYGHAIARV